MSKVSRFDSVVSDSKDHDLKSFREKSCAVASLVALRLGSSFVRAFSYPCSSSVLKSKFTRLIPEMGGVEVFEVSEAHRADPDVTVDFEAEIFRDEPTYTMRRIRVFRFENDRRLLVSPSYRTVWVTLYRNIFRAIFGLFAI
jgi:hypothetical protein